MSFLLSGFSQARGAFNNITAVNGLPVHTYKTDDLSAVVDADGYFNEISSSLQVKDIIACNTNDAFLLLGVVSLTPNVVTNNAFAFIPPGSISDAQISNSANIQGSKMLDGSIAGTKLALDTVDETNLTTTVQAKINQVKKIASVTLSSGLGTEVVADVDALITDKISCSINSFGTPAVNTVSCEILSNGQITFTAGSGNLTNTIVTYVILQPVV